MEQQSYMDALAYLKRMNSLLNETLDLSRQLAEGVDRGDQVTVRMLLPMRRDPIKKMQRTNLSLQALGEVYPQDEERLSALLRGEPGRDQQEAVLADQIAVNGRLYQQLMQLDKAINMKLARDKSIYQ